MPSIPYIHDLTVHNFTAAETVLPFVFSQFGIPHSVVDIGCGIGTWLTVAQKLGANTILGIDGNFVNLDKLTISNDNFVAHDLHKPFIFEKKYNLALCLEVAEHLPKESAINLVETLTSASNILLFSAALPHQGGQNHINEQSFTYWFELFANFGFFPIDLLRSEFWNDESVEWWYRQNMFILTNETHLIQKFGTIKTVNVYIHPDLFLTKIRRIQYLEGRFMNQSILQATKNWCRSIIEIILKIFNSSKTFI